MVNILDEYCMATRADVSKSIKTPGKCRLVCCCRCCLGTKLCLTLCDPTVRSTPGLPVSHLSCPAQSSPKFISIEFVISSNRLILCHPFLLLPSVFPSIRVFAISQFFTSGAKVLEFQLQHQPFQ